MRVLCVVCLIASGCTADPPRADGGELARIDGIGGYVRWLAPTIEGDEPEVEIVATFGHRPLLAPAMVEEHGPIGAYLALADELPAALLGYAPRAITADDVKLPSINRAMLDRAFAASDADPVPYASAGCDVPFADWVRSSYGDGYGHTSNCTTNGGFTEQSWQTYYCRPGLDNDCTYPIGGSEECSPGLDESCSAFVGWLQVARARHRLYSDASYAYNVYGHRYRFAAANCDGTGSMIMWHRRGGAAWSTLAVPPRSLAIRVAGRAHLPAAARVRTAVSDAQWQEVVPLGGASYQLNQLAIDPLPGSSGGYACADVQRQFETSNITWALCNGGRNFCDDNTCNNCWDH